MSQLSPETIDRVLQRRKQERQQQGGISPETIDRVLAARKATAGLPQDPESPFGMGGTGPRPGAAFMAQPSAQPPIAPEQAADPFTSGVLGYNVPQRRPGQPLAPGSLLERMETAHSEKAAADAAGPLGRFVAGVQGAYGSQMDEAARQWRELSAAAAPNQAEAAARRSVDPRASFADPEMEAIASHAGPASQLLAGAAALPTAYMTPTGLAGGIAFGPGGVGGPFEHLVLKNPGIARAIAAIEAKAGPAAAKAATGILTGIPSEMVQETVEAAAAYPDWQTNPEGGMKALRDAAAAGGIGGAVLGGAIGGASRILDIPSDIAARRDTARTTERAAANDALGQLRAAHQRANAQTLDQLRQSDRDAANALNLIPPQAPDAAPAADWTVPQPPQETARVPNPQEETAQAPAQGRPQDQEEGLGQDAADQAGQPGRGDAGQQPDAQELRPRVEGDGEVEPAQPPRNAAEAKAAIAAKRTPPATLPDSTSRAPEVTKPPRTLAPKKDQPKGKALTKKDIETRLADKYRDEYGGQQGARDIGDDEGGLREAGVGNTHTFYHPNAPHPDAAVRKPLSAKQTWDLLPGEVKDQLTPAEVKAAGITVTSKRSGAGAETYADDIGWNAFIEDAKNAGAGPIRAAKERMRGSERDPEGAFLSALHDAIGGKAPKGVISVDPAKLKEGDTFTVAGRDVRVIRQGSGEFSYLALEDGEDLPTTPVDALQSVPMDKGTLGKGGAEPATPNVADATPNVADATPRVAAPKNAAEAKARMTAGVKPETQDAGSVKPAAPANAEEARAKVAKPKPAPPKKNRDQLIDEFHAAFDRVPFDQRHATIALIDAQQKASGEAPDAYWSKRFAGFTKGEPETGADALDQPGSPAFKSWFGESKVVDTEGNPLVVYHGTTNKEGFEVFNPTRPREYAKIGDERGEILNYYEHSHEPDTDWMRIAPEAYHFGAVSDAEHFGSSEKALEFRHREIAGIPKQDISSGTRRHIRDLERMAGKKVTRGREMRPTGDGSWFAPNPGYGFISNQEGHVDRVYPVYLSIKNPKYVGPSEIEHAGRAHNLQKYKDEGYDGVIFTNDKKDLTKGGWNGLGQIVAFYPEQIKSVNNRGTWDPNDPNILHQGGGDHPKAPVFYSKLRQTVQSTPKLGKTFTRQQLIDSLVEQAYLSTSSAKDAKGKPMTGPDGKPLSGLSRQFPTREAAAEHAAKQPKEQKWVVEPVTLGKDGVKPEEVEWARLDQLPDGKLTRQDVLDHLDEHAVRVEEVVRGEPNMAGKWEEYRDGWRRKAGNKWVKISGSQERGYTGISTTGYATRFDNLEEAKAHYDQRGHTNSSDPVKFSGPGHNMPGGANQRELLITMPRSDLPTRVERYANARGIERLDDAYSKYFDEHPLPTGYRVEPVRVRTGSDEMAWTLVGPDGSGGILTPPGKPKWVAYTAAVARLEAEGKMRKAPEDFRYDTHWPDPNVLAFARFNDRTMPTYNAEQATAIGKKIAAGRRDKAAKSVADVIADIQRQPSFKEDTKGWTVKVNSENEYTGQSDLTLRDASGGFMGSRSGFRGTPEEYIATTWAEQNSPAHAKAISDAHDKSVRMRVGSSAEKPNAKHVDKAIELGLITPAEAAIYRHANKLEGDTTGAATKTLFLEEVQSDWHQTGRKKGYQGEALDNAVIAARAKWKEADKRYSAAGDKLDAIRETFKQEHGRTPSSNEMRELPGADAAYREYDAATEARDAAEAAIPKHQDAVPDAPFKTNWSDLVMKRMIRWAAENGYDRIAWTPGDVQNERWSLEKHIGTLHIEKLTSGRLKDHYAVNARDKGGREVFDDAVSAEKLPEVVGEEMAAKIIADMQGAKPGEHYEKSLAEYRAIKEQFLAAEKAHFGSNAMELREKPDGTVEVWNTEGRRGPVHMRTAKDMAEARDMAADFTAGYRSAHERLPTEMRDLHQKYSALYERELSDYENEKRSKGAVQRTYSGLDLKTGGEPMRAFYDRILVNTANKLAKKWGGKVELGDIPVPEGGMNKDLATLFMDHRVRQRGNRWEVQVRDENAGMGFDSWEPESIHDTRAEAEAALAEVEQAQKNRDTKLKAHGFDITPEMRADALEKGMPLFQGGKRGAVQFLQDGRAIVHAIAADGSTGLHEIGHVWRRNLEAAELATVEAHYGIEGGKWSRASEERYAEDLERYVAEGKAPTPELEGIFAKFKQWMADLYRSIKGTPLESKLSDEMRAHFDRLLTPKDAAEAKAKLKATKEAAREAPKEAAPAKPKDQQEAATAPVRIQRDADPARPGDSATNADGADAPPVVRGDVPAEADDNTIGLNKAEQARIRKEVGLDELPEADRRKWTDVLDRAKRDKLDERALEVADEILTTGRQMTDAEHAGAVIKAAELANAYDDAVADATALEAKGNAKDAQGFRAKADALAEQIDTLTDATRNSRRETARALAIGRMMLDRDSLDLVHVIKRAEQIKGGKDGPAKLSTEERDRLESLTRLYKTVSEELAEAKKRETKLREDNQKMRAGQILKRATERAEKGRRLDVQKQKLKIERNDIKKQLLALGHRVNEASGLGAEALYLVGKLALNYANEGAITLQQVIAKVREDMPDLSEQDVIAAIDSKDPKRQARAKTAAENRVRELKAQAKLLNKLNALEKGIEPPKPAAAPKPSPEVGALREKLDAAREAKRLAAAVEAAKKGVIKAKSTSAAAATPEIAALRKTLTELRKTAYRTASNGRQLERTLKAINEAQDHLANATRPAKAAKKGTTAPEALAAARGKLDELKRLMRTEDTLKDLQQQLDSGDIRIPEPREPEPVTPELERLQIATKKARSELRAAISEMRPWTARKVAGEIFNTSRTMMATADMSATLRQALMLSTRRPGAAAKAFSQSFRAFFSDHTARQIDNAIHEHPNQLARDRAGLYLADVDGQPSKREENFQSNVAKRLPFFKTVAAASERHMVTHVNLMRVAAFDGFLEAHPNATREQLKAWADYVNKASGRGDLGKFAGAATELSTFFFAPRFAVSRFQAPWAIVKHWKDPIVRKEIAKDLAAFVGTGMAALALAYLAGADVGMDPRDPDFGKIRVGDHRADIWAGFQQPARLIARVMVGATDRAGLTGSHLTAPEKDVDPVDLMWRFSAFKFSPAITVPRALYTGKDAAGQPQGPGETLLRAIAPITLSEIVSTARTYGAGPATAVGVGSFFGFGMGSFPDSEAQTRKKIRLLEQEGKRAEAARDRAKWNAANPKNRIAEPK